MRRHVLAFSDSTKLGVGQLQPGDRILGDGTDPAETFAGTPILGVTHAPLRADGKLLERTTALLHAGAVGRLEMCWDGPDARVWVERA